MAAGLLDVDMLPCLHAGDAMGGVPMVRGWRWLIASTSADARILRKSLSVLGVYPKSFVVAVCELLEDVALDIADIE